MCLLEFLGVLTAEVSQCVQGGICGLLGALQGAQRMHGQFVLDRVSLVW